MTGPHRIAAVLILGLALLLAAFTDPGHGSRDRAPRAGVPTATPKATTRPQPPAPSAPALPTGTPRWRSEPVLPDRGMLVAYYGTPGTGSLGVLGETSPAKAFRRLQRAAAPFERPGRPVRPVFELIVSVADGHPGKDRDFSHDVGRAAVQEYVDAARDLGALLVLDLQTGRTDFLEVARRWEWALLEPHVSLAIDPEWRVRRGQRPARVIGSVGAGEVNRTSAWLSRLVVEHDLPEKLLVVHQFRTSMVRHIGRVKARDGLQLVQHVDGFGNRAQKLATYRAVARPDLFAMGFKLFYDEDFNRMGAKAVHKIRPRVRFVSYQ
ncbi:hypothetical protein [Nocardioides nitrophenolicus]|uniref:hypothetical protein n=1 Tax=Nocardioides nitrophenolicus TaxID=60489 RepID=UPI001959E46A|nr:hypothetical protein [Nocardioides nitrophenolicus]MBM7519436.1 hypothetical protein [Nocardioides nitrophenolicus]